MGLEEVEVVKRLFYYPRGREKKIDRLGRNGSWQGQQRFDTQLQDFLFFFPSTSYSQQPEPPTQIQTRKLSEECGLESGEADEDERGRGCFDLLGGSDGIRKRRKRARRDGGGGGVGGREGEREENM